MIYLFIAGSYTPWLNLRQLDGEELIRGPVSPTKPTQGPTVELRWAVWLLATLGILYQQIFHER